ncbi:MAG TPA: glutathione S-transferase family protein, partial [Candidatus Kryptonia bacterium]|nr:glutathione S-transferase family protein [Candidatus Kryptonia bacterium]
IFGNELSPYSVKVRSYFRYKQIPHEWIVRNATNEDEFRQYAKLPLIPLVVTPDGQGIQDSTPIIERFEQLHAEPSIYPSNPALGFLSALIEEYGDEWGNKPMFHYRWWYEADRQSAAARLAESMMPGVEGAAEMIKGRMVPRLKFVGSNAETKDTIEGSFKRQVAILNAHLAPRKYLFGGRPALGDFGLYAQLYQCSTDPTAGGVIKATAPNVLAWIRRMLDPRNEGGFEAWGKLAPTLMPLLKDEIGGIFFPWTLANARAVAAGEKEFSMTLAGRPYSQETQKYHAKSLAALRSRYSAVADKATLDSILREAGCYEPLNVS